jgi:hypothetical protein
MIIFEPQCIGFVHAKVNAAYILLYSKAFPNNEIIFYGEAQHIKLISDELISHAVSIKYIPINIPDIKQSYIDRLICEFRNVSNIFKVAKQKRLNVFFLSITSATLLAVKLFSLGLNRNVFIVIHGVLEKIIKRPSRILDRVFWFRYYLTSFNFRHIKYILISKFIEENTLQLFPKLRDYSCSLDLPYDLSKPVINHLPKSSKIIFASAGVAAIAKGSHHFFELAQDILHKESKSNLEFCYIGQFVDEGMMPFVNNYVTLPSMDSPLNQTDYQKYFMRADFLVFFYPKDSYKLIFSGVFMDAVKYEKPIIAIKNDFFSYYFEKYGDLGWLCEDYQEVLSLVLKLSEQVDSEKLVEVSNNFKKIKFDLSVDNQADILKELLV